MTTLSGTTMSQTTCGSKEFKLQSATVGLYDKYQHAILLYVIRLGVVLPNVMALLFLLYF
jgi:hypothetical protein